MYANSSGNYYFLEVNKKINAITDKPQNAGNMIVNMLNKTQHMFKWNNLPETIPQMFLELYLQTNGNCCIAENDGQLYAYNGGFGGEPDVYYQPTIYVVANPAQRLNKSFKIGEDCVLVRNDTFMSGLLPINNKFATMLTETEVSMYMANINSRIVSIITAGDARQKQAADAYLEKIKQGDLSVILDDNFMEDCIKTNTFANASGTSQIQQLIEMYQYLKSTWSIELGMNANWNAKRESITSGESAMNDDVLTPLVTNMLHCRELACECINKMFGTNISVELDGIWAENKKQMLLETEILEAEAEQPEEEETLVEEEQTEEIEEEQTEEPTEETTEEETTEEETTEEEETVEEEEEKEEEE